MTTPATALARIHRRNQIHAVHGGTTFCGVEVTDGIPLTNGSYPSCKKCRKGWKKERDSRFLQTAGGMVPALVAPNPISLDTLCKVAQGEIDAMSWDELDGFVNSGINCIALNQASITAARQAMTPAIALIHDKLTRPGQRTDLMEHPPITWKMWCENKRRLGCKRTLDELVRIAKLGSSEKLLVDDVVVEKGTGEKGKVTLIDEATDKVSVRFDGEKVDQTVSPADIGKAPVKTTKLPQVGEIIREGERRFEVVYVQTIEDAINLGDTIGRANLGRANPFQKAHGMIPGDIIVSFAVRDVTWKTWTPKFAKGDKVEGQVFAKGEWISGIVIRVPRSIRGLYWVTDQKNPDLNARTVRVGGLGEIKGFGSITHFSETEMRAK